MRGPLQTEETFARFQKFGDAGKADRRSPILRPHKELEDYLGKYCGLMLYLREMDEDKYAKICAVSRLGLKALYRTHLVSQSYFSAANDLHSKEMTSVFMAYMALVKVMTDDDPELSKRPSGRRFRMCSQLDVFSVVRSARDWQRYVSWGCHYPESQRSW